MSCASRLVLLTGLLTALGLGACKNRDGDGSGSDGDGDGDADDDDDSTGDDDDDATDGDPGRVTIHRLNRTEYNNTIRDLFGEDLQPANDFPAEDPSFGFDNIADVLSISPLQLELYARAADEIATTALRIPVVDPVLSHFEAEEIFQSVGSECCNGYWNLWAEGEVSTTYEAPAKGEYHLSVRAFGQQAGDEPARMAFIVDGVTVGMFDVEAVESVPEIYEATVELDAGSHQIAAAFTNDFWDEPTGQDRNLAVDFIDVEGPFGVEGGTNEMRERLLVCDPSAGNERECMRQVLEAFAPRAWRRALTDHELDGLMGFYDVAQAQEEGFESALRLSISAILASPHFLFRVELDEDPTSANPHELTAYELASRLSYFLWSSMPDAELFARAADNTLLDPDVLAEQVDRMLDDPKAEALVDNFAGQWLYIRALDDVFKDVYTFPEFDDELRAAMREERSRFFRSFVDEPRSMTELVNARDTFVNERLARFYGIDGVTGSGFQRVQLNDTARRGVLTQAGLLAVLAHPETTSPVKRGKWVLEQLLCTPPPPPPSDIDIPPLDPGGGETMKEKLAEHRENPLCASCHDLMDPIGLGLEHYDGIGKWRDTDEGLAIDATGTLPGGAAFDGGVELADQLAADERLMTCVTDKAVIYALGRGLTSRDEVYLEEIGQTFADGGHRFAELVRGIAQSEIFRMRRGEP